jgi:hypothetical protein
MYWYLATVPPGAVPEQLKCQGNLLQKQPGFVPDAAGMSIAGTPVSDGRANLQSALS